TLWRICIVSDRIHDQVVPVAIQEKEIHVAQTPSQPTSMLQPIVGKSQGHVSASDPPPATEHSGLKARDLPRFIVSLHVRRRTHENGRDHVAEPTNELRLPPCPVYPHAS